MSKSSPSKKSQADKFRDAAREAETDDREETLDRIIREVAGHSAEIEVEQGEQSREIIRKIKKRSGED